MNNEKISHTIKDTIPRNFLYAFVVNGKVKYIGKSIQTVKERFSGYINPGKTQCTNIKNHKNIKEQLREHENVDIYILADDNKLTHGEFNIRAPLITPNFRVN